MPTLPSTSPATFTISVHTENDVDSIAIYVSDSVGELSSHKWLEHVFFPKVIKWTNSMDESTTNGESVESLSLISMQKYNEKYNELKTKYGLKMVEVNLYAFKK